MQNGTHSGETSIEQQERSVKGQPGGAWEKRYCFLEEYRRDFDAMGAARRSGYAPAYAQKMIGKPKVQERLAEIRRQELEDGGLRSRVIRELMQIAFADAADFLELRDDGQGEPRVAVKTLCECASTAAIAEIQVAANGAVKLKMASKENALAQLIKLLEGLTSQSKGETAAVKVELRGEVGKWAK